MARHCGEGSLASTTANIGNGVPRASRNALFARLDVVLLQLGQGCSSDGGGNNGDAIALVATCAGVETAR